MIGFVQCFILLVPISFRVSCAESPTEPFCVQCEARYEAAETRVSNAERRIEHLESQLQEHQNWIQDSHFHSQALYRLLGETREDLAALHATIKHTPYYHGAFFEQQYWSEAWGPVWQPSGGGSDAAATSESRNRVEGIIQTYGVQSVLDAPCGDVRWILPLLNRLPDLAYIGVDVVRPVIEANKRRFKERSNWRFIVGDVTVGEIPEQMVDLAICRDLVQHLNIEAIKRVLKSLRKVARYVLISSQNSSAILNLDLASPGEDTSGKTFTGNQKTVAGYNLLLPPFNLPAPLDIFQDGQHPGKVLLLLRAEDILDDPQDRIPSYIFGDIREDHGACGGWQAFSLRFMALAKTSVARVTTSSELVGDDWLSWKRAIIYRLDDLEGMDWARAAALAAVAALEWAWNATEQLPQGRLGQAISTLRGELWHAGLSQPSGYELEADALLRAILGVENEDDEALRSWIRIKRLAALARSIGFDAWDSTCYALHFAS